MYSFLIIGGAVEFHNTSFAKPAALGPFTTQCSQKGALAYKMALVFLVPLPCFASRYVTAFMFDEAFRPPAGTPLSLAQRPQEAAWPLWTLLGHKPAQMRMGSAAALLLSLVALTSFANQVVVSAAAQGYSRHGLPSRRHLLQDPTGAVLGAASLLPGAAATQGSNVNLGEASGTFGLLVLLGFWVRPLVLLGFW